MKIQHTTTADSFFGAHFRDYDAIIAPAATGEAIPISDGTTGDAVFCLIWTLAGLPCLTLPMLVGANGLPVGVQVVTLPYQDELCLHIMATLEAALKAKTTN